MLALAEDFDAAAWDDKILDLKKKKSEYESEKSKADVEIASLLRLPQIIKLQNKQ